MSGTPDQKPQLDADGKEIKPNADAAADADADADGADDFADPVKAKAEVVKLRAEAAKHRTKAKSLEDQMTALNERFGKLKKAFGGEDEEDEEPEVKISKLQEEKQALEIELSVAGLCRSHEVPVAQEKYFRFLLSERLESLEEGEELSEEQVAEIAAEAKKVAGGGGQNSTGLSGGKKPNADSGKQAQTLEEFAKMSVSEKSLLYTKNPTEYQRLFSGAKEKGLL